MCPAQKISESNAMQKCAELSTEIEILEADYPPRNLMTTHERRQLAEIYEQVKLVQSVTPYPRTAEEYTASAALALLRKEIHTMLHPRIRA